EQLANRKRNGADRQRTEQLDEFGVARRHSRRYTIPVLACALRATASTPPRAERTNRSRPNARRTGAFMPAALSAYVVCITRSARTVASFSRSRPLLGRLDPRLDDDLPEFLQLRADEVA